MTRNTRSAVGITTTASPVTIPEPPIAQVDVAVAQANREGRAVFLVSAGQVPSCDPLEWLAAQTRRPRVYWRSPSGEELAGVGSAWTIQASPGASPFRVADGAAEVLQKHTLRTFSPEQPSERFLGGFAFAPQEDTGPDWEAGGLVNARLVLPEALLIRHGAETRLVLSVRVEPGSGRESVARKWQDLSRDAGRTYRDLTSTTCTLLPTLPTGEHDEWLNMVRTALGQIDAGTIQKVVLSRQSRFTLSGSCDFGGIVSALRQADANCYQFAFQWTDEAAFVGATPERLFRRDGPILQSDCLAGTVRRGGDTLSDRSLAGALLTSTKDRLEHSYVVEAILHDMQKLCARLEAIPEPRIVQLATLQHLFCPVTGRLRDGVTVADILQHLHPTPAVGGWPRAEALTLIRKLETHGRGWYAGPVGWIGTDEAEFAVAIRSALIRRDQAIVFAGAGIVAGSDPELEWQETEDKLQAFVRAVNLQQ